jgi:BlaI family penicillinase repressor
MQILAVLWRSGPSTARGVLATLPDGKQRAYTTVLSTMQVMEKKGLLRRSREGLTDFWRPAVTKSGVLGPFLRGLVANIFGGDPAVAMQHILEETDVQEADVKAIRKLLDAHKPESRNVVKMKGKGK